ncbi:MULTISPECIES: aldehyde dehydrogenase family protein [Pseudonocardia]|uniref:Sulfoacetaldehyde dehydrogenase n=2 Tax=Pseudonocardia TaxID=1847 RepID=A0A1Y2MHR3_PSEAH|nr:MULTISPECIES: aldehyde dehydrogenase family protein [Pseudonocardia]OSY34825.1 Sulfoacetaldehyde dehydrogenase [Pseudonocardia autotrophica]TDN73018.1 acyl-CoA reductase-like NAD-dependent aldehyde dehydrogenase [Pseudonocardia autotrophica]BBG03737.1 aldehyde dehydrogenase [Pseudonocardia autotrophica]GEC29276.1 aldehyde dehydrogenase [Pseudonocardia saturnea]
MRDQKLFIDGTWVPGHDTATVRSPYDDRAVGSYAVAGEQQVADAVHAARRAMEREWSPAARAAVLRKAERLLEERSAEFVEVLSAEAGKPVTAAAGEIVRARTTLGLSAEEATRLSGEFVPFEPGVGTDVLAVTVPVPVGVVAAITPFNFPLNLVLHKIGPALAAGCAVVLKPSERTPLTAGLLAELLAEAGVPAGRLNVVTGAPEQIVEIWADDPGVAVLTFTGSSAVGWALKARSPRKRHVLELGSNTALLADTGADLDAVVDAIVTGGFTFAGQACVSVQRVYAVAEVYDALLAKLVPAVEALVAGDPADERTVVGPVIGDGAVERLLGWIEKARVDGASVLTGGTASGRVVAPTVVADVSPQTDLVCGEAFGPVVTVQRVADLEAGIGQVNDSRFGLNTAIFTRDVGAALAFARRAEAGTVMVNVSPSFRGDHMPYGGVKDSGQGREGVRYAVQELVDHKLVLLAGQRQGQLSSPR